MARLGRPGRLTPALSFPLVALALLATPGGRGAAGDDALQARLEREAPAALAEELSRDAHPGDVLLWVRRAQVERFRCNLLGVHAFVDAALARDPWRPEAYAARAEARLLEADGERALAATARALALPGGRDVAEVWRVRALALIELKRYEEALEAAQRATALAPGSARAAEAHARACYHLGDMSRAQASYLLAVDLDARAEEANLRLGNGFGPATTGRPWEEAPDLEPFRAALEALEGTQPEEASRQFERLLEARPDAFKYRLGLGTALAQRRRQHEAGGLDPAAASALYALLPAPELPGLEQVVPDVATLSPARRHALLVAAAPMRPWWEALVRAGARHDLLTVPENLTDRESRAYLQERLTFDGRRYEHLRGSGGKHGCTGLEKLDDARELGFHTLAHELGHQLLTYGLPAESVARVKVLFAHATLEKRCLDHYAASDVDEYFAQGYEAFVSQVKRGCLKETQRHTRMELRVRDPGLFAFLVEHLDTAHETPEAMAPFLAALERVRAPAGPGDVADPPPAPR